jgi:phage baseplate assembly protein gpV
MGEKLMDSIVGVMKKVAQQEAQKIYTTELGIVTAIFPHAAEDDKDNYQCSIQLKNRKQSDGSDFELRKVPIATSHLGWTNIPSVNDLVLVTFIGGDLNAPVIIGRLYNDSDRPPVNKEKEILLQHNLKEGGSLKLDAEGIITLTSKDKKSVLTVKDQKIKAQVDENCHLTLKEKEIKLQAEECTVSLQDSNILIDNGTCKITISSSGIEIDAASQNITLNSKGGTIQIGDATTSSVKVGGIKLGKAIADGDSLTLSSHTHLGNMGAPCPILIPNETLNSIQAKARNTQVG